MSKIDPAVIGSICKMCETLPSLPPSILYHHILPMSRLRKNSESALQTSWHPGYGEEIFVCSPLLICPTQVSNLFGDGRGPQIYKKWTSNGGDNWEWCCKKWQEHSFVSDNACETIIANWSAQHNESESIQKRKRLENTYEKCAGLLGNAFNVIYAVDLLRAQKCWPSEGVGGQYWHRKLSLRRPK